MAKKDKGAAKWGRRWKKTKPSDVRALFNITEELCKLEEAMLESVGEHGEVDEAAAAKLDSFFEALGDEEAEKLEAYGQVIIQAELRAKSRKEIEASTAALRRTDEKTAERLKNRVKEHIEATGAKRIETPSFKFRSQRNGQASLAIKEDLEPESLLAGECADELAHLRDKYPFLEFVVGVNKPYVKDAIENMQASPYPWAELKRGTHLRM